MIQTEIFVAVHGAGILFFWPDHATFVEDLMNTLGISLSTSLSILV
jgi:hypothetical protein